VTPDRFRIGLLLVVLIASRAGAQTLPVVHHLNPLAEARSGLYYQPWVEGGRDWRFDVTLDYASMVEYGLGTTRRDTTYLLDAEALRVNFNVTRALGGRNFLLGEIAVGGLYDGFMDGFLDWYHGLFGIPYPERKGRPQNEFDAYYRPQVGSSASFDKTGFYLGDLRLGIGRRFDQHFQSTVSITLPTRTGNTGFERDVVSLAWLSTIRAKPAERLRYEGSFGLGYTPRHGDLSGIQERFFFQGTSGMRWRMVKGLWPYVNFLVHSPYYARAGAQQLDKWDAAIDFGGAIRFKNGNEFRFGMTEDLAPTGPAVDGVFRFGFAF
jgi:hypothetical protein